MIFNFILIITSTQKRLHNNNICCLKDDFERHKKLMFENYLGLYISFFKPQVGKITHSTNRGRSRREYKKLNSTKKFSIFFFLQQFSNCCGCKSLFTALLLTSIICCTIYLCFTLFGIFLH